MLNLTEIKKAFQSNSVEDSIERMKDDSANALQESLKQAVVNLDRRYTERYGEVWLSPSQEWKDEGKQKYASDMAKLENAEKRIREAIYAA